MKHWILYSGDELFAAWKEAMPEAIHIRSATVENFAKNGAGILWVHLAADEAINDIYPKNKVGQGQYIVVLADAPRESVVIDAITLGASGCCNSHAAPEVLQQLVLVVENGGLWVGQNLLKEIISSTSRTLVERKNAGGGHDWSAQLSSREREVAELVAGGASNREVAEKLSITERTAKAHLTSIFDKLGLRDRLQLSLKINGVNV